MRWNKEELELLELWLKQGWLIKDIANELDRTESSVYNKIHKYGLKSTHNKLKTTTEYILDLKTKNHTLEVLGEYINSATHIKHKCLKCKHIWNVKPNHVLNNGRGCPICARQKFLGFYSSMTETIAKALKHKIYLYVIQLDDFIKIGITKNKDKSRFYKYKQFDIKLIDWMEFNPWDAIKAEEYLHEFYKDYKYIPNIKFGGHNECFKGI